MLGYFVNIVAIISVHFHVHSNIVIFSSIAHIKASSIIMFKDPKNYYRFYLKNTIFIVH